MGKIKDMKKYWAIAGILAIAITACTSEKEGFVVNGTISGEVEDSTQVFLKATDSMNRVIDIDTTTLVGGTFSFEGVSDLPRLHYLFIDGLRGNVPFITENGTITITAQKDSLPYSEVKGTPQNKLFMGYLKEIHRYGEMVQSLRQDLNKAQMDRDTIALGSLREEYFEIQEEAKNYNNSYIKEHPEALISALLLDQGVAQKTIPLAEVTELYEALTDEIKATRPGKRVKQSLDKEKATAIGSPAPDFSGPTPDGKELALNQVKGKLTLIDFWAAWCKPCRMENPNIVSVYEKYKDKGFNVIGVSLDRKAEDWLQAIEVDGLAWNHVSHLQYFQGPIAEKYGINAIPAAFLLDENGVIVAKNLRGPALEQKVAELLN